MYYLANFFYFQTLFTEFKKNSPLAHNWPVCEEGSFILFSIFGGSDTNLNIADVVNEHSDSRAGPNDLFTFLISIFHVLDRYGHSIRLPRLLLVLSQGSL